jgi:S-(hydroxymethyl)mycothiol dehydrogenase
VDRGVVLTEVGRFGVVDVVVDEPGPGEVAVRIEATGVCHSDLHVIETGWSQGLPVLLGHEGAGVVEAVGEGVEHVAPGDRVVLGWRSPCGECRWCERGARQLCRTPAAGAARVRTVDGTVLTGVFGLGTFVTRTVVRAEAAVPVPQELPVEEACLLGCAIATGVGSVLKTAQVWEGARVGVIGCGAVGLSVVQGARIAGAAEIHAVDLDPRKLEAAELFGATHTGPGGKLDFVFDVVGLPETVEQGLGMLGHAGTLVYIGLPRPGSAAELPLQRVFDRRMRILVSHGGDHVPADDFPMLAALALAGKLDLAGMVTKTIALEDVPRAFEEMKAGDVIRSVVVAA